MSQVTITFDRAEAAVVQDALHAYARAHEGAVVGICESIEAELSTFTGFQYDDSALASA